MTNIKTYNTNQIGGCVVTIETNTTKIVIDFGENLSGSDSENVEIEGLTYGTPFFDAVFFTHYHGDHIGRIGSILTDIPLYIGKTAIKVIETIADAINNKELLQILSDHERVHGLAAKTSVKIGDIVVTPYTVDHSAYEAFMFLIETPDKTIFHTGDFREHGYQGAGGLMPVIRKYITGIGKRKVDILITEGTMLSRQTEKHYTEADMKRDALQLFENNRYVFLICSSTNVDSLATFYNAGKWYGMRMYCNWYVEKQLANYTDSAGGKSSLYRFEKVHQWHPEKELISRDGWRGTQFDLLVEHGFVAIIKGDAAYERWIQDFEERSGKKAIVIYSMWEGYVKPGKCQDKELTEFCQRHHAIHMHTSGHAYVDTLEKVINEINPNEAIIPIHTEYPERFKKLNISEELKGKVREIMAKQREKNEIELELIELLKSKAKSPKLPDAIIFSMSEGINQSLIMKLQRKAVGLPKGKEKVLNMQEDGAAFEGWAVVIRALYMSQKEQCHEKLPKWDGTITLDIADGEGVLPKYDIERGHYGRFLYRALRFYEEYGKDCGNEEWFDLSQNIKLKVKEFERFLLEADFENNIPGAEAGVNGNLENRIEAKFKDNGSLFGKIMKSQIPYISETVNRQLPCGLFRKSENEKVKEEDSIFTGGSSAIDFWNYSVNDNKENVMTIVELKADNVMIGIITEIFFYAHYCKDFFCEEPWFLKNKKEQKQFYRGYEILRNNEMKYINAVMLADKYHSLIDDEVIKVLCNCKFKKVIRYFREWYHFEISISE